MEVIKNRELLARKQFIMRAVANNNMTEAEADAEAEAETEAAVADDDDDDDDDVEDAIGVVAKRAVQFSATVIVRRQRRRPECRGCRR